MKGKWQLKCDKKTKETQTWAKINKTVGVSSSMRMMKLKGKIAAKEDIYSLSDNPLGKKNNSHERYLLTKKIGPTINCDPSGC
tara:strand:- start:312 stop:560 length:249 start_codon:yes stop_codon:yes gene_type:complete